MNNVLIPIPDNDTWAKATAEVLADIESDPKAVLLYMFTEDDLSSTAENLGKQADSTNLDDLASRKSVVRSAARTLNDNGITTSIVGAGADDDRGGTILTTADNVNAERIYMFSRKRSPVGKAVFGSAIQDVLFESPVPIVVVPPPVV